MIGITSYGAYVPRYRMNRKVIFDQMGWFNGANAVYARGEKAVANYDEDALTMACSAARDCMQNASSQEMEGLLLASLSLPYAQRQNATIVLEALDLHPAIRTGDFTGSLRAGTTALLSALDSAETSGKGPWMVTASDCRVGKPGSANEYTFGDGAAALAVGREGVIAAYKGFFSLSHDFIDYRRLTEERFLHAWEDRWIREEGYGKILPEAARGLMGKYGIQMSNFAKVIIPCPLSPWIRGLAKSLGATDEQIQDNLQAAVGDTGAALPLMMLVAALEEARPGDKILLLGYGSGADALYFEATPEIEKTHSWKGIKAQLARREDFNAYGKYLVFRDLLPMETGVRGESILPTAMTMLWQQGRAISSLVGVRCEVCGTPQYPKHRICVNPECEAVNPKTTPYRFSDKIGKVFSFTGDNLAFSWDPPAIYGFVEFEEGGKIFLDFTDCRLETIQVGMPVEMSFRRKYTDKPRGYHGYFWKAVPVKQDVG